MQMLIQVSSYGRFQGLSGGASFIFEKFCRFEQLVPQKDHP